MENWLKYCLSITLLFTLGCDRLSNETYHRLSRVERQKMSSDYVSITNYTELGSQKYMQLLEKAVRLNPENEQAWKKLSWPFLLYGKYQEWHAHSKKAIELNPETWQGWMGHQKLYYFRDYGGALYDLDATDTLTLNKTDYAERESVDYLRGLCYLGLKDFDKAIEFFEKYISSETESNGADQIDDKVYIYTSLIHNENQEYEKAILEIEKVKKNEILADHHFQKAKSYFMLGQIDQAAEQIELAREKFEEETYNKNIFFEVPAQIYMSNINELSKEIACFQ